MSTGYSTTPLARRSARAESFIQSLVPWPISPDGPQNPVDIRIPGNSFVDIPLNLTATGVYRQTLLRFLPKNEYAGSQLTGNLEWDETAFGKLAYTGNGTAFQRDLQVGDYVWYVATDGSWNEVYVAKIVSNTTFLSNTPVRAAVATGQPYGRLLGRNIPTDWSTGLEEDWTAGSTQLTGSVVLAFDNNVIAGTGTAFLSQVVEGDRLKLFSDSGAEFTVNVMSVVSDDTIIIWGNSPYQATDKAVSKFYTRFSDISFDISTSAGTVFAKGVNVQSQQGAFGSADLRRGKDGVIHLPYFEGRSEAIMLRVYNHASDARRVHGHVYTVRVLT